MSKITAVITGRDFIKEVELDGSTSIVNAQDKFRREYPGSHVQFFTGRGEIEVDHAATGLWSEEELSINQIAQETM
jgi:hypothetical protein